MGIRRGHCFKQLIVIALTLTFAGCAALTGGSSDNRIEGYVWYKERMLLPPDAQIEVRLEDVSKADAPATVIASTRFKAKETPPWSYTLTYDPELIKKRNRYGLRAKITREGKLLFVSTDANLIFPVDQSTGSHRILVSRVNAAFAGAKDAVRVSSMDLTGVSWKLSWIDGKTVDTEEVAKPLNMVFVKDGERVHGYAGCNSFSGGYSQSAKQLTFKPLAVTSMACARGAKRERAFLDALTKTSQMRIHDGELTLLNEDGGQLLRFKSDSAL